MHRKLLRRRHIFFIVNKQGKSQKSVCHFQPTQLLSEPSSVTSSFKSYDTREVLLQPWTALIEPTGRGDAASLYTSLVRSEMEKHIWFWAPRQERCVLAGESPEKNNENTQKTTSIKKKCGLLMLCNLEREKQREIQLNACFSQLKDCYRAGMSSFALPSENRASLHLRNIFFEFCWWEYVSGFMSCEKFVGLISLWDTLSPTSFDTMRTATSHTLCGLRTQLLLLSSPNLYSSFIT